MERTAGTGQLEHEGAGQRKLSQRTGGEPGRSREKGPFGA